MKQRTINFAAWCSTLALLVLLSSAAARAQGNQPFSIMTFNVHGGNSEQALYPSGQVNNNCVVIPPNLNPVRRRIALYNSTHARKLDALALQEVHRGHAEQLARDLGYPPPHFVMTLRCNQRNPALDYGNAILSPHPMADRRDYKFRSPEEQQRGEVAKLAAASVRVAPGKWVRVYNSHLTINPKGNEAEHQRWLNMQVSDVLYIVNLDEFFVFHGVRSVFAADFNTTERTDAYDHLTNAARGGLFDDAWRKLYPAGTGRTTPASTPHLRFDHIFFDRRSDLKVWGSEVLDICERGAGGSAKMIDCISDHRPVVTTFVF
jgi:endonuclease/exonuclease/phosphatase family metal-dependent hydrolase